MLCLTSLIESLVEENAVLDEEIPRSVLIPVDRCQFLKVDMEHFTHIVLFLAT